MVKIIIVLVLLACGPAYAVPPGFNVQGRIIDAAGMNLSADNFKITFSIFDAPTGGSLLWNKTLYPVTVRGGNFQVTLEDPGAGGQNQFLKDVFGAESRYLEFQVLEGGAITAPEPPVIPRQQLVSVPFAVRAGRVERRIFPKGVIVMWSGQGSEAPDGWCLCDGRTCPAPDGSNVTTPDLSGRFILGAANASEVGATGGGDNPVIDPPGTWSSYLSGWSFHSYPGLTKSATKVRWQKFDVTGFQMGAQYFYPKYYRLAYIMKL
ncbi:MAG: phage tail protein [Elusimicrobia bacterium]|nr:phage tail protein [Elusimicrobiota bacterium]